MRLSFTRLLIGRPVANREAEQEKLTIWTGLPAMGLDGLSSAAYGPEAALAILVAAGSAGLDAIQPITWAIVALLAVLFVSYWQTIEAYPSNGGSYVVAKENLGSNFGLLASAALMLDYMLNVAVGIAAGVGALTSAFPILHPHTLVLCLVILLAITIVNLRGTRESGAAWVIPTYLFVLTLGIVLIAGAWEVLGTSGAPQPVISPPAIQQASESLGIWLVLRAFASGCTAMTGVEAVSNGIDAFAEPRVTRARGTLALIVAILALLLIGISTVAQGFSVMAMDQTQPGYQSVLSQIIGAVWGRGPFYYITIGAVLAVLCLSANTSFVGFPRLCHLVAQDRYLPHPFAIPGRRLVYSVGIGFLAAGAAGLLILFGGITDRLIPLFAVGAFLAFTLSQAGMAAHWWRRLHVSTSDHATVQLKLAINGFGALATGAALFIILAAKFVEGAWITLFVIPATIILLRGVRRYYDDLDRQVLKGSRRHINIRRLDPPIALVPIKRWDKLARKAVEYAIRISPDVTALHLVALEGPDVAEQLDSLRKEWSDYVEGPAVTVGRNSPTLKIINSEYRSIIAPLLKEVELISSCSPARRITVVLPELVEGRWWGYVMHANRERRIRAKLLAAGGRHISVCLVPWQLTESDTAGVIAEEEPESISN
jgi:amino acid transporter